MKRVAVLLGMVAAIPSAAWAQTPPPTAPPSSPAPAPDPGSTPPPAPAAPPSPAGAPAPIPSGDPLYTQPPGVQPAGAPAPGPQPPAGAPPAPGAPPPPFEPPPPPGAVYEPPPPPVAKHLAPRMALSVSARLGWFFPFGNAWADGKVVEATPVNYVVLEGVPWTRYASSGPMFELDVGLRVARSYTVFALWERAQTRSGSDNSSFDGEQAGGDSDFWAVGLRANSDPNRIGFVTEVALGYRRARTRFDNGTEYQFIEAPFEARLGLGGEYRTSRLMAFSLLGTIGVGSFGNIERVGERGPPVTDGNDVADGHAWATINLGAHFDLLPTKD
ncbi:MAG TPA: hypothetical protein VIW29_20100 [Polyangiaceae bacterium]